MTLTLFGTKEDSNGLRGNVTTGTGTEMAGAPTVTTS